jgi:hypothetical protein
MKKSIFKTTTFLSIVIVASCLFISCSDDATTTEATEELNTEVEITDTDFVPTDWSTETHSKDADPNFDEVFDNTAVKRFDFVISENNWEAMLADMTNLYGNFGTGGGALVDTDEDPIFVPASVYYNGTEWYKVGVRFIRKFQFAK